jgi:hypothetical protein
MKSREIMTTSQSTDVQHTNGNAQAMADAFGGMYREGFEAGYASGHEAGYRHGFDAGRVEGSRCSDGRAAAPQNSASSHAAGVLACEETSIATADTGVRVGIPKTRLMGLPCAHCRRFMYSDEERCPYCRAPRAGTARSSANRGGR